MQCKIHGKPLIYNDGKFGVYEKILKGFDYNYVPLNPANLVSAINEMPIDQAIKEVTALRNEVAKQVNWQHTPQNELYPIIQRGRGPTRIEEVRGDITNTKTFCNNILKALKGE